MNMVSLWTAYDPFWRWKTMKHCTFHLGHSFQAVPHFLSSPTGCPISCASVLMPRLKIYFRFSHQEDAVVWAHFVAIPYPGSSPKQHQCSVGA